MGSHSTEVWKQQRSVQDKYDYFLMALAWAAIAFSVQRTVGMAPRWSMLLLLGAVLSWGASIFSGLLRQTRVDAMLTSHFIEYDTESEEQTAFIERFRKELSTEASRWRKAQNYTFFLGAALFICWHVISLFEQKY